MADKLSFSEAAADLEILCEQIDSCEDVGVLIQQMFARSQDTLADTVNRKIKAIKYAESQILIAKEMRDSWNTRAKGLEKSLEYIKNQTKSVMLASPNLPYKGSLGGFKLCKNSQPSLKIDDEIFDDFKYIKLVETSVFDKDALKSDLKDGKVVLGASLEYGEHVRISLNL